MVQDAPGLQEVQADPQKRLHKTTFSTVCMEFWKILLYIAAIEG